jgi:hypothetical protein
VLSYAAARMRLRSTFLITAAGLVVAGASATPASAAGPVLVPDGVTATQTGKLLELRFPDSAAPALAKLRSRQVDVSCASHPPAPLALADDVDDHSAYGLGDVAPDGTARIELSSARPVDACDLAGAIGLRGVVVARVALTPRGAAWNDEVTNATALRELLVGAHGAVGYRPAAQLGPGVVALDGPGATPPAGQTGYWTDGTRAAAVSVSAAGRRLVLEDQGDALLAGNVLEQSDPFAEVTADIGYTRGGLIDGGGKDDPEDDHSPTPYHAETPVAPADGVHAVRRGRTLTVRFAGRAAPAFRAVAGRRVLIACATRPALTPFPRSFGVRGWHRAWTRVPAHGGRVTFTFARAVAADACLLADQGTVVAVPAPTAAGREWIQDLTALVLLTDADTDHLVAPGATTYRTTADAVAHSRKGMVAMPGPGSAAPTGRVGLWTDGAHRAGMATRSLSGRRYVVEDQGDGVLGTNVFGDFSGLWLLLALEDDDS